MKPWRAVLSRNMWGLVLIGLAAPAASLPFRGQARTGLRVQPASGPAAPVSISVFRGEGAGWIAWSKSERAEFVDEMSVQLSRLGGLAHPRLRQRVEPSLFGTDATRPRWTARQAILEATARPRTALPRVRAAIEASGAAREADRLGGLALRLRKGAALRAVRRLRRRFVEGGSQRDVSAVFEAVMDTAFDGDRLRGKPDAEVSLDGLPIRRPGLLKAAPQLKNRSVVILDVGLPLDDADQRFLFQRFRGFGAGETSVEVERLGRSLRWASGRRRGARTRDGAILNRIGKNLYGFAKRLRDRLNLGAPAGEKLAIKKVQVRYKNEEATPYKLLGKPRAWHQDHLMYLRALTTLIGDQTLFRDSEGRTRQVPPGRTMVFTGKEREKVRGIPATVHSEPLRYWPRLLLVVDFEPKPAASRTYPRRKSRTSLR